MGCASPVCVIGPPGAWLTLHVSQQRARAMMLTLEHVNPSAYSRSLMSIYRYASMQVPSDAEHGEKGSNVTVCASGTKAHGVVNRKQKLIILDQTNSAAFLWNSRHGLTYSPQFFFMKVSMIFYCYSVTVLFICSQSSLSSKKVGYKREI